MWALFLSANSVRSNRTVIRLLPVVMIRVCVGLAFSYIGLSALQWPHQGAWNSTSQRSDCDGGRGEVYLNTKQRAETLESFITLRVSTKFLGLRFLTSLPGSSIVWDDAGATNRNTEANNSKRTGRRAPWCEVAMTLRDVGTALV